MIYAYKYVTELKKKIPSLFNLTYLLLINYLAYLLPCVFLR